MSVVFAKIQMRRGTAAQWAAANPILAQGELAFETDTGLTKVGDGATAYASLPAYATYDQMLAAKEALDEAALDVAAVEASRVAAAASAATASTKATEAAGSAAAALASEQSIVAKVNQAEQARIDAIAYAAVAEEKADEIVASANAAAADASAADADRIAAEAARTGAEAAQAIAQGAAAGALASEVAADASADVASGAAASALSIYGSVDAQNTAVAVAQAQASLAAGFAASAASVAQQDLSGITAQALHRSPNAITSMFIYDTSKDSDGGAWTEKCQHTSWWNEAINGKWLGAQASEALARAVGGVLGPELLANSGFATDTSWDKGAGCTISGGKAVMTAATGFFRQALTGVVPGVYEFTVVVESLTSGVISIEMGGGAGNDYSITTPGTHTFRRYWGGADPAFYLNSKTDPTTAVVDLVSLKAVNALTTASGDYFQLSTDGKFYRLWKNMLSFSTPQNVAAWTGNTSDYGATTAVTFGAAGAVFDGAASKLARTLGGLPGFAAALSFTVKSVSNQVVTFSYRNPAGGNAVITYNPTTKTASITSGSQFSAPVVQTISADTARIILPFAVLTGANCQFMLTGGGAGDTFSDFQWEPGSSFTSFEAKGADGSITEVFRGNKRDFPRLAGIVAEAGNVTIYDLTEPGRPMWMRFVGAVGRPLYNQSVTGIAALNGMICASEANFGGLTQADFARDYAYLRSNSASEFNGAIIANRNAGASPDKVTGVTVALTNNTVNAVAMTVLPDSPVDPVTGLRVPTIAVATNGGVSLIRQNGSVESRDYNAGAGEWFVQFDGPFLLVGGQPPDQWNGAYVWDIRDNTVQGYGRDAIVKLNNNGGAEVKLRVAGKSYAASQGASVNLLRHNKTTPVKALLTRVSPSFNTGWMTGDIRRCFLSDTEVGELPRGEIGWPSGTLSVSNFFATTGYALTDLGDRIRIERNAAGFVSYPTIDSGLVVPNVPYSFEFEILAVSSGATAFYTATNGGAAQLISNSYPGAARLRLTATPTGAGNGTARFSFAPARSASPANALTGDFIEISKTFNIVRAVSDRSYRNVHQTVFGTLTRAQLASGTSLVGYSGFSAANYLREPYSADLDFGTGEWTASAWLNIPATLPASSFPTIGAEIFSGSLPTTVANPGSNLAIGNVTAGKAYRVSVTVTANTGGTTGASFRINGSGGNLSPSGGVNGTFVGTLTHYFVATASGSFSLSADNAGANMTLSAVSLMEVAPALVFDRAAASGPALRLGVQPNGRLLAEAFDGTTTRTVTTSAAYNTAQWLKARVSYTTDGTLAILVNGREVAATRGAPLLTLNNASAVLTIGNSFALDAPFPGSIALLKLGATVPTPEQATFMFEQEKQLFRAGALSVLPDSGAIVDMAYDDATDRWVAISAANEIYWTGLVRNSVQAVPAGSFSRVVAGSGLELAARTGTNPGVDVTIPAYGLREELVRRAEAAARLSRELVAFDFVGGFTANTTSGSAAITNVAGLTYPGSLIGARVSGAGIPANTRIVGVSGTTIYLSAVCTATATGVSVSFLDFNLPVAFEARAVLSAGALRREGSTQDFVRLYDGFLETIRFAVAPGATAWVQIQATRGTMQ